MYILYFLNSLCTNQKVIHLLINFFSEFRLVAHRLAHSLMHEREGKLNIFQILKQSQKKVAELEELSVLLIAQMANT